MGTSLQQYFDTYAAYHRHPMNRLTHALAIPAIVFHLVAMLDWVSPGIALAAIVGSLLWYARLSLKLAAIMMVLAVPLYAAAHAAPVWLVLAAAGIGWTVQLAGHLVWEKNSPAFMKNVMQTLVGPLFFLAVLIGDYRPRQRSRRAA